MTAKTPEQTNWRSDTLLLGFLSAMIYLESYAGSDWHVPHWGTAFCWIGALMSFVPAPRELRRREFRKAALLGLGLSVAVLWHTFNAPCTGPCK